MFLSIVFSRLAVGDGAALAAEMTAERRQIVRHYCHRCECCSLAAAEQRGVLIIIIKKNQHARGGGRNKRERRKKIPAAGSFPDPSPLSGARQKMPSPGALPLPRQLVSAIVKKRSASSFAVTSPQLTHATNRLFPFQFERASELACCLCCPPADFAGTTSALVATGAAPPFFCCRSSGDRVTTSGSSATERSEAQPSAPADLANGGEREGGSGMWGSARKCARAREGVRESERDCRRRKLQVN